MDACSAKGWSHRRVLGSETGFTGSETGCSFRRFLLWARFESKGDFTPSSWRLTTSKPGRPPTCTRASCRHKNISHYSTHSSLLGNSHHRNIFMIPVRLGDVDCWMIDCWKTHMIINGWGQLVFNAGRSTSIFNCPFQLLPPTFFPFTTSPPPGRAYRSAASLRSASPSSVEAPRHRWRHSRSIRPRSSRSRW